MDPVLTRQTIAEWISAWTKGVTDSFRHIEANSTTGLVVLNLCSGVDMIAEAMRQQNIPVRQHISVEKDSVARSIATLHHNTDTTSLPQDMLLITREQIIDVILKYGTIDVVIITTPCQDLSSANSAGTGLAGSESRFLWNALDILDIIREINPNVKYIIENVQFKDKFPGAFREINTRLGHEPLEWDARECSAANRKRCFWTNIQHEQPTNQPVDANTFIEGTARLVSGRTTAPCIMASHRCELCKTRSEPWCLSPHNHAASHYMHTSNPVLVQESSAGNAAQTTGFNKRAKPSVLAKQGIRHARVTELEQCMGLAAGYTAMGVVDGETVIISNIDRLKSIGGGVDTRQAAPIVAGLKHICTDTPQAKVKPHTGWNTAQMAKWLTAGPLPITDPASSDWDGDDSLYGAADLIRCAIQGFPLRYEGDRIEDIEAPNGSSAERNPESTQRELDKEIDNGHIIGPWDKPPLKGFRVTPRGIKPEATKDRPISCANQPIGRSVNDGIPKASHMQMASLQNIERRIKQCYRQTGECWMAKADIKAAYRTQPVRPEDWQLQGIKWQGKYYIDTRMSFGCRSSVDQWLRISSALSHALTRWGVHNFTYIDDFIFICSSKAECEEAVRKFKALCKDWDVILKEEKDGAPAQKMTALGIEYDLIKMTRRITDKRRAEIKADLITARTSNDRRHWEHLIGVLWFVSPCVRAAKPHTYAMSTATTRARHARRPIAKTPAVQSALDWWIHFSDEIANPDSQWHGDSFIATETKQIRICMGDAGSEWGMGGFDESNYYYTKWPDHMWQAVQRTKSTSSLHMEAFQVLVAARAMGSAWRNTDVVMRLDCLALVDTLRKGYHQHQPLNDILQELSSLQIQHNFVLRPMWVRRTWNEAADALSKNDMARFWANVEGDRTLLTLTPSHLRPPDSGRTCASQRAKRKKATAAPTQPPAGGPKTRSALADISQSWQRATGLRREHEQHHDHRPVKEVEPIPNRPTKQQLAKALNKGVHACKKQAKAKVQDSGFKHYKRFCQRAEHAVLAPALPEMRERITKWMYDAPQSYKTRDGKPKKSITTGSIKTYLSHIDRWYSELTNESRGCLSRYGAIADLRKIIDANFRCGERQVHGITYDTLQRIMRSASAHPTGIALMLRASYSLAFYGLLRPTEYMLTPLHSTFDATRHMRACDIQFYRQKARISAHAPETPDSFSVNIKMAKNDQARGGSTVVIGATGLATCPVKAMHLYMRNNKPDAEGPLFTDPAGRALMYKSALKVMQMHIGAAGYLYGLHSFRVGGAQALALAGRSVRYIMSRGRWKSPDSVATYVAAPAYILANDSRDMSVTEDKRCNTERPQNWGAWHTNLEGGEVLPQLSSRAQL